MSEDRETYDDDAIEAPAQHVVEYSITDAELTALAERHADVDAHEDYPRAKEAAKECQQLRKKLEDARVFKKADALAWGKAVDAEARRIRETIEAVEKPIKKQIDEIDSAEALAEAARIAAIESKLEQIQAFANDRHSLTLEELNERLTNLKAFEITEENFDEFLKQAGLLQLEAETKLSITIGNEKERLAQEEAQCMAAEENARRQKELDERQAAMDAEDAERKEKQEAEDAERKAAQDEKDRIAREKQAAENTRRQGVLDKQAKALEEEEERQATERKRIEQEQADKEEAERIADEEAAAEAIRLAQAPDLEKLKAFRGQLDALRVSSPMLETDAGKRIQRAISGHLQVARDYITQAIEEMK